MSEEARVFLEHIVESIQLMQTYTDQLSRGGFRASPQAQDGVIRRLEIIGEAVKNPPSDSGSDMLRRHGESSPA